MYANTNDHWAQKIYPALTRPAREELLALLCSYCDCSRRDIHPSMLYVQDTSWCYPFVDLPDNFDHGDYETWVEMCEEEISLKHKIPLDAFCY